MTEKLVIIGAGGHAREIADVAVACAAQGGALEVLGFVDDNPELIGQKLNGVPVLGTTDWLREASAELVAICGIGSPHVRRKVVELLPNVRFTTLVHPAAVVTPWMTLGTGVVITAGCVLTNSIVLGAHTHINRCATVSHDTVIGDFVHVSPGCVLSGNVNVGDECDLGAGAVIIPGITIGARTVVGAGAVIIRDLPADVTAVGNPARVIKHRANPTAPA